MSVWTPNIPSANKVQTAPTTKSSGLGLRRGDASVQHVERSEESRGAWAQDRHPSPDLGQKRTIAGARSCKLPPRRLVLEGTPCRDLPIAMVVTFDDHPRRASNVVTSKRRIDVLGAGHGILTNGASNFFEIVFHSSQCCWGTAPRQAYLSFDSLTSNTIARITEGPPRQFRREKASSGSSRQSVPLPAKSVARTWYSSTPKRRLFPTLRRHP